MQRARHFEFGPIRVAACAAAALLAAATGCGRHDGRGALDTGIARLRDGKAAEALKYFERAERKLPGSASVQANLGIAYWEMGQATQALAAFRRAAELAPGDSRPLEWLGHVFCRLERWDEARRTLSEAQDRDPDSARIMTARAVVELRASQTKRAFDLLTRALSVDPAYPPALYNMAKLQASLPDGTAASTAYYQRFLQSVQPTDPHAEIVRKRLNQPGAGMPLLGAPREGPSPALPLLEAGREAMQAQDITKALISLKDAVKTDPLLADAVWELARLYDQHLEDAQKATDLYIRFRETFPRDSRVSVAGERLQQLLRARRAPLLGEVAGRAPVNASVAAEWYDRGLREHRVNNWPAAVTAYQQALAQDASHLNAALNLGIAYKAQGDLAGARDAFEYVLRKNTGVVEAAYQLALVYRDLGVPDRAVQQARNVLERQPDHARAYHLLGTLYWTANQPAEARQYFQKFVELAPDDPLARQTREWLASQP